MLELKVQEKFNLDVQASFLNYKYNILRRQVCALELSTLYIQFINFSTIHFTDFLYMHLSNLLLS